VYALFGRRENVVRTRVERTMIDSADDEVLSLVMMIIIIR
jgi:hypothetical protein